MPFTSDDGAARLLASIVESSDDAIITTDPDGVVVSWNRGAERLYGYTAADMKGRSIFLLIPETHRDEFVIIVERIHAGQVFEHQETVRRTKDGRLVDVWLTVSPFKDASGQLVGASSVARDISARKQAELALRSSELRWRSVVESAVDALVVIDARGRIEAMNPAAERLFGYRESEVLWRNVSMLMPEPYRHEHDGYLSKYLATGDAKIIGIGREVKGRRRDGSIFPLHLSVGEMSVAGERKFTGILHDLTERVRLEERLRTSEERWRSIIESAVDGIIVIDARGRIEAFNPAAETLFGYKEEDVVGQNINILMPSPYYEEHDGYLARYLRTGERRIIGIGREVTGRRHDGTTFPVHLTVGQMSLGGEPKFTGILHDLSGRVQMEEQLREQVALARLGEMAAVIAHEVKNPLAGIRGAIQVIGGRLPPDSKDAAVVTEIVARIDSLNELMRDLLLFARPPQPHPAPLDVAQLVTATADLLLKDPALKDVRVNVDGSAPSIAADAGLLQIVLLNLMMNGAHAMRGQGTIRIALASLDQFCHITVTDSGPGIPVEIRERIFTPFFTTKARGTGLGLPTARRLIEAHGGTIDVECPPEGGTTVTLCLPLHQ